MRRGHWIRQVGRHKIALGGMGMLIGFGVAVVWGLDLYAGYLLGQLNAHGVAVMQPNPDLRTLVDHLDARALLTPPNKVHLLGTDDVGRDLLARSLYGGRISLAVGFVAMLIAVTLGTLIGASAGFLGGMVDQLLMRLTDLFLSLPAIPLTLLTVYLFREPMIALTGSAEAGIFIIVVVMIGGMAWMQTARVVRATFLTLKQKEFVEAAIALGVGRPAIMFRHMLPNAIGPIIVAATLEIGSAIITESTISFLGVGFPPDTPTWGRLVTDGSQYLQAAPWLALVPGSFIFLTVLSINFLGDGLRDAFDPHQR